MIWKNTIPGVVDSTASRFNETSTYKKSDYVWYVAAGSSPKLYKAKEDINAGAFDASKWEEIVVTNEFVNKDLVHSEHKDIKEDFEGNKFGYRKYETWYEVRPESDSTAAYNKGDVVYARAPWDNAFRTFICIQDGPVPRQDVLDDGEPALHWDWDNNTVEANENLVPVENEIYACEDDNWHLDFYKYSGGTYTKLEPMAKNIAALKAAGFNSGDWFVSNDGEDIRIFKFLTDNPGYEFVEADIFDVAVCQDEVAKKLEDIDPSDYYYGMPFYKGYQLYALLATTPVYEQVVVDGTVDHDEFEIEHFGNVYALKLDSINDIHKIFDNNCYRATQALIYNIWDDRFDLPVAGPTFAVNANNDIRSAINIIGTPVTDNNNYPWTGITICIGSSEIACYNVYWDLKEGLYAITIDGFSNNPGGEEQYGPRVDYCSIRNSKEFNIDDATENPNGSLIVCSGGFGRDMEFNKCVVNVYYYNEVGTFVPTGFKLVDTQISFSAETNLIFENSSMGDGVGGVFQIVNSDIYIGANDKVELERFYIRNSSNSNYHISANEIVFDEPISAFNFENCSLNISGYENISLQNPLSQRGFIEIEGSMKSNNIVMASKWNNTHKQIPLWFSNSGVFENDEIYGAFDNTFAFKDYDDTPSPQLAECPFKMDGNFQPAHSGNRIYTNKYSSGFRGTLVWHDYPASSGADFHAEFIRAMDKLTTQLGLTYTAIQDASGDYQYTFNLNN